MSDDKEIVTASDLEAMSPNERQRQFDEHVVTDLASVAPAFLERALLKGRALLETRGAVDPIEK